MNSQSKPKRKSSKFFCCTCIALILVLFFCLTCSSVTFLTTFQPFQIQGNSMTPSYKEGEYYLTNKITYKFSIPQRNSVIVFISPADEQLYIKRIIAVPGDVLKISNGEVYINNMKLNERYLSGDGMTKNGSYLDSDESVTIPENKYFVMGDMRDISSDSRHWGLVPKENIVGKVQFCYWNCGDWYI